MVKFLIGRLYSDNHTRYFDVIGCCVISFGGSLFMLCVLACYIYVVCFDVTVQCILTWSFVYFSDRFFLFLCDKPRLLFCFGVVFEIFWRGHYLCLCFGVSLFTLCVLTLSYSVFRRGH